MERTSEFREQILKEITNHQHEFNNKLLEVRES
jgi:hypothetical protein